MKRFSIKYSQLNEFRNILGDNIFQEAFEQEGAILEVIDDVSKEKIKEIVIDGAVKVSVIINSFISNGKTKFQWMYYSEDNKEGMNSRDAGRIDFVTKEDAIVDIREYAKEKHLRIQNILEK